MEPRVTYARTTDGVSIAYTAVGTGPALVLLPGVPFSNFVAEWKMPLLREVYERLGSRVRLIQYDGRGTGHSQRDVSDLSLEAMLRDLGTVIEHAQVDRFAMLGFYNSCTHAIAYAALHPDRVTRLVLFGGSARGWHAMSSPETQALLSLIERDWNVFVDMAAHAWMGWSAGEAGRLAAEMFRAATVSSRYYGSSPRARRTRRSPTGFPCPSTRSNATSPTSTGRSRPAVEPTRPRTRCARGSCKGVPPAPPHGLP